MTSYFSEKVDHNTAQRDGLQPVHKYEHCFILQKVHFVFGDIF